MYEFAKHDKTRIDRRTLPNKGEDLPRQVALQGWRPRWPELGSPGKDMIMELSEAGRVDAKLTDMTSLQHLSSSRATRCWPSPSSGQAVQPGSWRLRLPLRAGV